MGWSVGGSSSESRRSQAALHPVSSLSVVEPKGTDVLSALGGSFASTPMIVPIRGNLEQVRRFMVGDLYIGRGSKQNGLSRSPWSNSFKVAVHGRQRAIERFASQLSSDEQLKSNHADVLITEFRRQFPTAFDRDLLGGEPAPSSHALWPVAVFFASSFHSSPSPDAFGSHFHAARLTFRCLDCSCASLASGVLVTSRPVHHSDISSSVLLHQLHPSHSFRRSSGLGGRLQLLVLFPFLPSPVGSLSRSSLPALLRPLLALGVRDQWVL